MFAPGRAIKPVDIGRVEPAAAQREDRMSVVEISDDVECQDVSPGGIQGNVHGELMRAIHSGMHLQRERRSPYARTVEWLPHRFGTVGTRLKGASKARHGTPYRVYTARGWDGRGKNGK